MDAKDLVTVALTRTYSLKDRFELVGPTKRHGRIMKVERARLEQHHETLKCMDEEQAKLLEFWLHRDWFYDAQGNAKEVVFA